MPRYLPLRKLPSCKRCKIEMSLVTSIYDHSSELIWEWECSRCGKVVPKNILKEEELREEDLILAERFGNAKKNIRYCKKNS